MRVVILVPWRAGSVHREWNWDVTRPYLEAFGWPVVLGDREGPWSRAAAVNEAAKSAGSWEVALIADADTIPEPEPVRRAVGSVSSRWGAIRPHDTLWNLNREQSRILAQRGPEHLVRSPKQKMWAGGGLLVISRQAWETVNGYDESYVGWGHEDSDLHTRLLVEASWDRIPGNAYHLWHPRDATETRERYENRRRMRELQARYAHVIAAESKRRGWDVGAHL